MTLKEDEIRELIDLLGKTRDREIDCDACLEQVAEFAEQQLSGKEVPEALDAVQQHLDVCGECREEYRVLMDVLRSSGDETRN